MSEILMKNTEADRDAWLQHRTNFINSTDASVLFGLSPYSTPFQLWHEKKEKTITEFDNDRMKAGRFLEPAIAKLALDKLGCNGTPHKVYMADKESRIATSFDWKITSGKYKNWIMEIKNVDGYQFFQKWNDEEAPDHIEIQAQHQLAVDSKRKGVLIVGFKGGNELNFYERERDEDLIDAIKSESLDFWHSIENNTPPPIDFETDSDYVCKLLKKSNDEPFICGVDDPVGKLINEFNSIKTMGGKIEKRQKEIKAEVFTLIGECGSIVIDGQKAKSTTTTKDNIGTPITAEMVGTITGIRSGYRQFR